MAPRAVFGGGEVIAGGVARAALPADGVGETLVRDVEADGTTAGAPTVETGFDAVPRSFDAGTIVASANVVVPNPSRAAFASSRVLYGPSTT